MKKIKVRNVTIGNKLPIVLIAGPCALESEIHALKMSTLLADMAERLNIPFIYKTSFDKANRTSITSLRGVGLSKGVKIFRKIKEEVGCLILTDVHETYQCDVLKDVVDILQIPAYLSRQTDLITEATKTGLAVNVKKGQFMAPRDISNVVEKIKVSHKAFVDSEILRGKPRILLTDRGVSFGYNTLVSDMRALPIMAETGYPVIFDATHSVQQPSGAGGKSGGEREFVSVLARAAVAVGVAGVFMEVHDNPDNAWSDGPNMLKPQEAEELIKKLKEIDEVVK